MKKPNGYIAKLRERTRTADGVLFCTQTAFDNFRRCNPDVDCLTDPVGAHLHKQVSEAEKEFARLYDELKALTWGKKKSLADSIQIEVKP